MPTAFLVLLAAVTSLVMVTAESNDDEDGIVIEEEKPGVGLRCVNCMNCKIFEVSSHSIDCEEGQNRCLVRTSKKAIIVKQV